MKILKVVLACFALIVATFLIIAAFLPAEFTVSRSQSIDAPPVIVFAQVNDLKQWEAWQPWLVEDPDMELMYSATTIGEGASYTWSSDKTGDGKLTITESVMGEKIVNDVDFGPNGNGQGEFLFAPEGDGTKVTWTMRGNLPYPTGRYFGPMMDSMLGAQFEDGLTRLKTVSEKDAQGLGGLGKVLGQGMHELGKELGKALDEAGIDMNKALDEALSQ